ncbi:MAG: DinB family protein [Acidobacteria bacterium]|nr:DinB family protein [Acidobacteriota bacterium]
MTKLCFALVGLSLLTSAQELSQGDRDRALSHLHGTRKLLLDQVAGLSEAQWKFKPADDKWSLAEVVEHLVLTEKGLFGMTLKVAEGPAVATLPANKATDEAILKMVPNRDTKVKAPDMFVPTGRFGIGAPLVEQYKDARAATLDFTRQTKLDLRHRIADSPLGPIDGLQWLLFISAHNERHLGQIAEIKSDSKYPR